MQGHKAMTGAPWALFRPGRIGPRCSHWGNLVPLARGRAVASLGRINSSVRARLYQRGPAADDPGDPPPALTLVAAANLPARRRWAGARFGCVCSTLPARHRRRNGPSRRSAGLESDRASKGALRRAWIGMERDPERAGPPTRCRAGTAPQRPSPQEIGTWLAACGLTAAKHLPVGKACPD